MTPPAFTLVLIFMVISFVEGRFVERLLYPVIL